MSLRKINVFSQMGLELSANIGVTPASNAWGTANLAIYCPFPLYTDVTFNRFYWVNGGTANGNVDVALYDKSFNLLIGTGATLQAGVNAVQVVTVASTAKVGDMYYIGISLSSATGTIFSCQGDVFPKSTYAGFGEQTTAHPLPNPATPVQFTAARVYPMVGIIPVGGI